MYYNDKRQVYWSGEDGKTYVYDAVMERYSLLYDGKAFDIRIAVGSCFHEKAFQARHVLVKDLAKAAQAMRMSVEHLDRPCALYALYEGELSRETRWYILNNRILVDQDTRLEVAMRESFEELDAEFIDKHPGATDGCCATVALVTGARVVIATLGDVAAVVCMRNGEAEEFAKPHVVPGVDDDDDDEEDDLPNEEIHLQYNGPDRWEMLNSRSLTAHHVSCRRLTLRCFTWSQSIWA
eukprot:g2222.t1